MMPQSYDMNAVLDSVLDNIDEMMLLQIPQNTYTSNYSPFYGTNSNTHYNMNNNSNYSMSSYDQFITKMSANINMTKPSTSNSLISSNNSISTDVYYKTNNIPKCTVSTIFEPENQRKIQLKDCVYISKICTNRLREYIVKENWGKESVLLYKYLDYIFRCQSFNKQIIKVNNNQKHGKNKQYIIFHSGLQRRADNEWLFVLLIPNQVSTKQKWRVQFDKIDDSFLSEKQLLSKLKVAGITTLDRNNLPKRTKFSQSISDLLYDDSYSIEVNWEERLTTNRDRIYKVIGTAAFMERDSKCLKLQALVEAFDESLQRTQRMAEGNPRLAVPQGFVDTKHNKYRMELLLPIIIQFPRYHGKYYKFALAIGKSVENGKTYIIKSILTLEMAYANARLVGYVDSLWLNYGDKGKQDKDINEFCLNMKSKSN